MAIQRGIEMQAIPTVLITVEAEESLQARPPRLLAPRGHGPGWTLGKPGDAALQKWIMSDALDLLVRPPPEPGALVERDYG